MPVYGLISRPNFRRACAFYNSTTLNLSWGFVFMFIWPVFTEVTSWEKAIPLDKSITLEGLESYSSFPILLVCEYSGFGICIVLVLLELPISAAEFALWCLAAFSLIILSFCSKSTKYFLNSDYSLSNLFVIGCYLFAASIFESK